MKELSLKELEYVSGACDNHPGMTHEEWVVIVAAATVAGQPPPPPPCPDGRCP